MFPPSKQRSFSSEALVSVRPTVLDSCLKEALRMLFAAFLSLSATYEQAWQECVRVLKVLITGSPQLEQLILV